MHSNNDYLDYFNTIFDNDALFEDFASQLEGLFKSGSKTGSEIFEKYFRKYFFFSDLESQMIENKPLVKKAPAPKFKPQQKSPNDLFQRYWVHP